ncbi:MAG TPA: protein phosphatase 2C domain-containing protein [Thermomicrobiales bacterium]|nr:protein phosphatase 2C domain-containing protein [Thermomicrobiales bacterium]
MVLTEQRAVEVEVGSASRAGGRDHNEDAVLAVQIGDGGNAWLLAVADGMGGHEGGEVASRLGIETLQQQFAGPLPDDVALELKRAYRQANDRIWAEGGQQSATHMGTTLVAAVINGSYLTIANVGDSRAYLIRGSQVLQVTQDHSLVAEQVERGEIEAGTERQSPQRNVLTAAVGTTERLDRKLPAIYELSLIPEDRLLLCSDGFHDVVEQRDYAAQLAGGDPSTLAMSLASLAEQRGTTDNVSAVVLIAKPSRATEQRQQLETTIAEQRPQGNAIVVTVVLVLVVIAIAALALVFLL